MRSFSPVLRGAVLLSIGLAMAGCQNRTAKLDGLASDKISTASTGKSDQPSFMRTKALETAWRKDKSNVAAGLAYTESLDQLGQTDTKNQVLAELSQSNRSNPTVQAQLGKELLRNGKTAEALPMLEMAAASPSASWQTFSALGSAYDQQGRYGLAREQYEKALAQKPDAAAVMNNMAMSYSLEGNLPEAERILRDAMKKPAGREFPRIRQNLALVVGLQGRLDDAKKIASEDLPPDQVEANQAYLQQMLSQQNTWAKIAAEGEQG